MRIIGGMKHDSPDHWRSQFDECPIIKVDGVVTDHVIEADDESGYVVVVCYDAGGRLVIDETGQALKTERREGRVEIIGVRR